MEKLTEGMQRLCAVANRIVAAQGKVSRIEVDLLLDDLRELYDVALQFDGKEEKTSSHQDTESSNHQDTVSQGLEVLESRSLEDSSSQEEMAMMSTLAAMGGEPVASSVEPVADEPVNDVVADTMEALEQNDNALLFDEVILEEVEVPQSRQDNEQVAGGEEQVAGGGEPVAEQADDDSPVLESREEGQVSLLDYLNVPAARTLGESLGAERPQPNSLERKVDDLRTVININDKFSFMSELFRGNMKLYNDFIMRLNATDDRDEALAYVRDVAQQQKWVDDSPAVQAFYKVFDKKF